MTHFFTISTVSYIPQFTFIAVIEPSHLYLHYVSVLYSVFILDMFHYTYVNLMQTFTFCSYLSIKPRSKFPSHYNTQAYLNTITVLIYLCFSHYPSMALSTSEHLPIQ